MGWFRQAELEVQALPSRAW